MFTLIKIIVEAINHQYFQRIISSFPESKMQCSLSKIPTQKWLNPETQPSTKPAPASHRQVSYHKRRSQQEDHTQEMIMRIPAKWLLKN